ncbi:hypothetical protein HY733_01210 [Candidatus Uhrbacteria bacterium]|nr:hypothetical protein [Candidatus Uhrbacteria bacterium]
MSTRIIFAFFLSFVFVTPVLADSWPATDSTGTDIGSTLLAVESSFEPSGLVWHEGRSQFIAVGGQGLVATLNADGTSVSTWDIGATYDLEGVTVADTSSSYVYLLDENLAAALEFDLDTGTLTGRSWSFIDYVPEVSGYGAEGIAWVANDEQTLATGTSGGLFYIGWQYDGDIYVFNPDLSTSDSASFVVEIHMTSGYTDLSDLTYSDDADTLYAAYAYLDLMEERTADGDLIASYDLSGSDQEGVAIVPSCSAGTATIVFGEDLDQEIFSYSGYPISCDEDGDGVDAASDCDDDDASISAEQTYFLDADGDTLGSSTTTSVCSLSSPSGYVTNSSDTNDSIPNFGVEISGDGVDNDGDGTIDEYNTVASNGMHPYYSTLDPLDTALKSTSITSVSGTIDGDILVTYADSSTFQLDALSLTTSMTTSVRSVEGTAYLVVSLGRGAAIVNGYTGVIEKSVVFPRGRARPYIWREFSLGCKYVFEM